jgi:hypothetical protein
MFLAPAGELVWFGRQTTFPRAGPVCSGLLCTCPATEHRGVDPHIPGGVGNTVAMHRHAADGLRRELCRLGLTFLSHHGTPPVPIVSLFSKCPLLLNHNIPAFKASRMDITLFRYKVTSLMARSSSIKPLTPV